MLNSRGIAQAIIAMVVLQHVRTLTFGWYRGNFVRCRLLDAVGCLASTSYEVPQVGALRPLLSSVSASPVPDPLRRRKCRTDAEGRIKRPSQRLILDEVPGATRPLRIMGKFGVSILIKRQSAPLLNQHAIAL